MDESILNSIKQLLGIMPEFTEFDSTIMIHINSVFSILSQIGIGPKNFSIANPETKWSEFIGDKEDIAMVKSYVFLKVQLLFDPPSSSAAIESSNRLISELEFRLNISQ